MLKSTSSPSSKVEFEGAAIDILDELSRILGFSYTIYLSPDGKAGVENPDTGEWNGAIKEIMEKVQIFLTACSILVGSNPDNSILSPGLTKSNHSMQYAALLNCSAYCFLHRKQTWLLDRSLLIQLEKKLWILPNLF